MPFARCLASKPLNSRWATKCLYWLVLLLQWRLPDQLHQFAQANLQALHKSQQAAALLNVEPGIGDSHLFNSDISHTLVSPKNEFSLSLFSLIAEVGDQVYNSICEVSCQMLASSHCMNHSTCAPGLGSICVLSLKQSISRGGIDGPGWSVKTVKLQIVTPPPIA